MGALSDKPTAMILAAGRGERMRPLTDSLPKPLVPVAGKPLIEHHLDKLAAIGIEHVVINLSYRAEQIAAALGNGARWGVQIEYSIEPEALESGGGVATASALFRSEAVLLLSADVYSDYDYARLLRQARAIASGEQDAFFVLVPKTAEAPGGEFALSDTGLVHAGEPRLTLANIGVLARREVQSWPRGERFRLMPYYQRWVEGGRVRGEWHRGLWMNVTTPQDVKYLNAPARLS